MAASSALVSELFVNIYLLLKLHPVGVLFLAGLTPIIWYIVTALKAWYRLRHIPAPNFLATFSYLWLGLVTYFGKQFWVHRELHRKYGPLVRIGPNEVAIADPEIVRQISGTQSTYPRGDWYKTGKFNPWRENLFTQIEIVEHKRARTKVIPAYQGKGSEHIETIVDEQVNVLLDIVRDRYCSKQELINLERITCYFTIDVITSLGFGKPLGNMPSNKDSFDFFKSFHELWPQMSTCAEVPWIRKILFSSTFLNLFGPESTDTRGFGAVMGVAERYVGERFGVKQDRKDMLAWFIDQGFSKEECESESLLMLLAGTESTACAIRSTLIHAITHYEVSHKLRQEIKLAVEEGRVSQPITMEEARKLPYLQAVICEGIRMRPPLLGFFPKVVPPEGDTFYGVDIPGGTSIMTNVPERFLEVDETERKKMERDVDLAFGYGQWQCAGRHIAIMELNKFMFEMFKEFNLQLVNPLAPADIKSYGVFLEPELRIRVTEASQSKAEKL